MRNGPTTRRRQLGATMRKLRTRKGMTLEEAGRLVGVSKATVSRYETTEGPVKWLVVDALCREYGASEAERTAIVQMAKDAKLQGWWTPYTDTIPEWMNLMLTLENEATREDQFATMYVPGLLQTRRYAEAVHRASERSVPDAEVERMVGIRMRRQELFRRPRPPHIWAVLDESVIRRVVGGGGVMREQLAHLSACADSPHVTVQVLPFSTGAHASASGSFVVLGGAEPSLDVVYLDTLAGALFLETEAELDRYRRAFIYLKARALDPESSITLIRQAEREL
ncbi:MULTISPECIES: helix-turn-helix domain-containing protein [Streptomycetaceae]|uniref:Regulatory protein n=1 Tax=Streptantibioticus cattleyicolor (strain ATCC 35852 / DSM 46488 / JCM 4925 / NBRC 14057 / NRRL 8057) TaxID=1003195 RepID=F8JWH1_STREN|nr:MULTISPECIES: helix-turn-helix transcriptional regulator [Streptomycetaceae]AEW95751.1 regulatory protein [Streptantibioticus cattleyicolor NRRL 8057 = DSM 46488]MYS60296.1 helix-turn-helix domain-containing protein [Streptomyces sp. SID5468]CCB76091.1 putative regulatory protein [Streptantibioticus cattleyicolor NRRL 8057 = DSM 46488]